MLAIFEVVLGCLYAYWVILNLKASDNFQQVASVLALWIAAPALAYWII